MNDIYDIRGWCGLPWLWTTSQNDSLNRPCAAHDMSIERKLYNTDRIDQLFFERIELYSEPKSKYLKSYKPQIYKFLVETYRKLETQIPKLAKWFNIGM